MSAHLSPTEFSRLVDGEFSPHQLAAAEQHLQGCPACTSQALAETLLKRAVARAGQRYATPAGLADRLKRFSVGPLTPAPVAKSARGFAIAGWATAAALLLATVLFLVSGMRSDRNALVAEVSDLHIATLAANQPPQVISSDRHTVKPWFQGKLPFSFNLPSALPADVVLEGANLTYLENRPVAQLIYSIGRHRASVFLRQRLNRKISLTEASDRSGFHVATFATNDLEVVAISDVDPGRLTELTRLIEQAQ